MPYLSKGKQKGKKPRTTVWGKLLICECGHTFNMRRWDRADRTPGNAYQCYSSVQTDSYESRKKKGLPLEGTDYTEKLTVLQYALEQYTNINEKQDVPESIIEAFVVKIVESKDGFDWYLRFDGDPNKPRHCTLQGKRKTTTKIMVSEDHSATMDSSPTGCHQGWQELSDFQMFGTFTITQADAKAYMYAMSPLRRVHRFRDIQVNLYI